MSGPNNPVDPPAVARAPAIAASPTGLSRLIARVEALEGPDREVDLELGLTLGGWKHLEPDARGDEWLKADGDYYPWPPSPGQLWPSFTESLDAAVALVERARPGWAWSVGNLTVGGQAYVMRRGGGMFGGHANSPALALILALLRSLHATEGEG